MKQHIFFLQAASTMQLVKSMLVITLLFGASMLCSAQIGDSESDDRIESALERLELKYTIQSNGTFKLIFELDDDRTQIVLIKSTTYDFDGLEIREISAPAISYDEESKFNRQFLLDMLERNNDYKIGAFQLNGGVAPFIMEFGLRISATSSDKTLKSMLLLAARSADKVESEYSDVDQY